MRRILAGSVLAVLAAVPLSAQFEGTVVMSMPGQSNTEATYYIKGNMLAAVIKTPNGQVSEVRMIYDIPGGKMTMLVPMAMGGMKGMKSVIDLKQAQSDNKTVTDFKALGTSETIAGYKCDDYQETEDGKPASKICMTHELGFFAYAAMSGMGRASSPNWAKLFGDKPAFPLKITNASGKVVMVATSVQKGSVPSDTFVIPDGYQDMGAMGNMMGGRGRGPQF